MAALTPRQKEILSLIESYVAENGFAPTYDEIGARLGICKVTVLAHVRQLERKGKIRHEPYAARALELCGAQDARIPLAGMIQAGRPLLAVEESEKVNILDLIPLAGDLFALEVKGDSMIDEHIQEGDYVIVQKTDAASPGDVVVALIDGEQATLKRFRPQGSAVRLEPANAAYQAIVVAAERVRIQGTVVGVLRLFR